jgi:Lysozyme like domain/Putative peptidoglycan binding domain
MRSQEYMYVLLMRRVIQEMDIWPDETEKMTIRVRSTLRVATCYCLAMSVPSLVAMIVRLAPLFGLACWTACSDDSSDAELAPEGYTAPLWPTLQSGDRGREVLAAQYLLRHRGQDIVADGDFSPATDRAVLAFQQASGLTADAVIGAATWTKLVVEVKSGDANAAVVAAQTLLVARDQLVIDIDGRADQDTIAAIEQFQLKRCLASSGVVGVYTWSALLSGGSYCDVASATVLTMSQVVQLARDAGLPCGEALAIAAAIAGAESGLRGTAVNRNRPTAGCPDGSTDVGLWQINDCYHPEVSASCARDAACNAAAMAAISRGGTDWTPWSTYKNAAYLTFVPDAKAAGDKICLLGLSHAAPDRAASMVQ